MNKNFSVYNDRCYIEDLPSSLGNLIKKEKLVTRKGDKVSYCGVILNEDHVAVFFPRNSQVNDSSINTKESAKLLMKSIRKYHVIHNSGLEFMEEGEQVIGGDSLSLVSTILEDYKSNGLYSRRRKITTTNQGKPDWKRTISTCTPFQSGKNSIYLEFIGSKRLYESDCEVARIHAHIVKHLDENYGVFIEGISMISHNNIGPPSSNQTAYFISKLKSELREVYSDRDIHLLKSLIRYVQQIKGDDESNALFGIKHFHTMWEFMLSQVLNHVVNLNKKLPLPAYKTGDGKMITAASNGQRMDIVIRHPNEDIYSIIDAKYYAASSTSNSPPLQDLIKQFFYAKALKAVEPNSKILNFFIFPGTNKLWETVHMRERKTNNVLDTEYGKIDCLYFNPLEVIDCFSHGKKLNDTTQAQLKYSS